MKNRSSFRKPATRAAPQWKFDLFWGRWTRQQFVQFFSASEKCCSYAGEQPAAFFIYQSTPFGSQIEKQDEPTETKGNVNRAVNSIWEHSNYCLIWYYFCSSHQTEGNIFVPVYAEVSFTRYSVIIIRLLCSTSVCTCLYDIFLIHFCRFSSRTVSWHTEGRLNSGSV